jgi:hypothetical protein
VEDMGLKDGAKLLFTIDNLPKDMYVYRIEWDWLVVRDCCYLVDCLDIRCLFGSI